MLERALFELDEIAAVSSSTAKKSLLANISELTKHILYEALNPYRMFGVKNLPYVKEPDAPLPTTGTELLRVLDDLQSRALTGNAARETLMQLVRDGLVPYELLDRILKKDPRCGVGAKLVNSVYTGFIPEFSVALAQTYEGEDQYFPLLASIKYDGLRCLAFISEDDVLLCTRNGLEITSAESIKPELRRLWRGTDFVLDGELMQEGGHFQDSSGAIRKKNKQAENLEYQVFDILNTSEFKTQQMTPTQLVRLSQLSTLLGCWGMGEKVKLVDHSLVWSNSEVQKYYQDARSQGYEGLVLKTLRAPYSFKRSSCWVKLKGFETADVEVVGVELGNGKYKEMVGALTVRFNGKLNSVGTGLTDYQRQLWARNPNLIIGKMVEVSYHELTKDGNMRHSRFEKERFDL